MTLTKEEVEHIAKLARLELTEIEVEKFQRQLSDVLDYFVRLQELDTSDILPTSSVLPARGVMREDEPAASLEQGDVLRNAPQKENGQFRVPPVLEGPE
ncbi:MAG: Asp-tRNA(Asn)/Glu-tRNA(Gln) amidotransferase subunit GatC [Anaerolineaceae bacterium]|nr:Asp-tRNA(Asn)/Glu-tRNA(Gln) amidotransferase subunit GatC [Anaerolineaceae bacterium]